MRRHSATVQAAVICILYLVHTTMRMALRCRRSHRAMHSHENNNKLCLPLHHLNRHPNGCTILYSLVAESPLEINLPEGLV